MHTAAVPQHQQSPAPSHQKHQAYHSSSATAPAQPHCAKPETQARERGTSVVPWLLARSCCLSEAICAPDGVSPSNAQQSCTQAAAAGAPEGRLGLGSHTLALSMPSIFAAPLRAKSSAVLNCQVQQLRTRSLHSHNTSQVERPGTGYAPVMGLDDDTAGSALCVLCCPSRMGRTMPCSA